MIRFPKISRRSGGGITAAFRQQPTPPISKSQWHEGPTQYTILAENNSRLKTEDDRLIKGE
jgi:hypothetical protein